MLHVIAGRLAKDPAVELVKTAKGDVIVSNNAVYIRTSKKTDAKDIPIQITAWGKAAEQLISHKKGDLIQFVGKPTTIAYWPEKMNHEILMMGYEVKKIDENNLILKANNKVLDDFVKIPEFSRGKDKPAITPIKESIEDVIEDELEK